MFIARQPIFNKSLEVYGYELLHRSSATAISFGDTSSNKATALVLGGLFENGLNSIVNDSKAFVNFDYDFLLSDSIELIDPKKLIIEILEDVQVDARLMERLIILKEKGYILALDDFIENYNNYPIIPICDIIKYDLLATPLNSIKVEIKTALKDGKILLAEKVETKKEYEDAKNMGFELFQGFFFKKPSIISKSNNRKSIKSNYLKILDEVNKSEPSYDEIAKIIKSDVNLAYRLFRVIKNNRTKDVLVSIKKALIYMGFKEIERWINVLILQDIAINKPVELMRVSLIRSKFGEEISLKSNFKSNYNEISTMFLFSTLDALLDKSMKDALDTISLTEDIKEALIYKTGKFSPLLNLVYAYEIGDWEKVKIIGLQIQISTDEIYHGYLSALRYSQKIMEIH